MLPVGELSVQLSGTLNERTTPLASSGIVAPAGVADPLRHALASSLMSTTDAYDRSYQVPMGAMVATGGGRDTDNALSRFALRGASKGLPKGAGTFLASGVPLSAGGAALPDPVGFRGGHAALVGQGAVGLTHKAEIGGGLRLGVSGAADPDPDGVDAAFGSISLSADLGGSAFSLETGRVREGDAMLGARLHGAFGGVSAETRFLRASADLPIGTNGTVHLSASSGETSVSGSGLLRSGKVRSESFGVGVSRRNDRTGSVMSFGVSKPLGVTGGSLNLALPVGVAAASDGVVSNRVEVQSVAVGLDEVRPMMDLQFGYELPVGEARLGLAVKQRVGGEHGDGTSASIGVSFRF